jgi:alpha-L-fucosidase
MTKLLCREEYEKSILATRDRRMAWWQQARFGLFVHYGLYTVLGRGEWAMAVENWGIEEYEKLAVQFKPERGCTRKWARLAKEAGMKYMVLTTRHHEGFSLWDSQVNSFNVVNCCPDGFDIVAEFVESCRAEGLRVGFYFSLMDWHHPDSWRCAFDAEARGRFLAYLRGMLEELLGGAYGTIDILWYDVPRPMQSIEGWDSLAMNQRVRELQPDIIINDRARLDEDFGTPEGHIGRSEGGRAAESCMTLNELSWGYVDSDQAAPYTCSAQEILIMLARAVGGDGNLLLNIGPDINGNPPTEAVDPLRIVGRWLAVNGEVIYGEQDPTWIRFRCSGAGTVLQKGSTVYFLQHIWSDNLVLGGIVSKIKSITSLADEPVEFRQTERQVFIADRPQRMRDPIANLSILKIEFDEPPVLENHFAYPQLSYGRERKQ